MKFSPGCAACRGRTFRRLRQKHFADGYAVTEVFTGAVDLKLEKSGSVTLVNCKRWKVAQTGIGPLRELQAAKDAMDASYCMYVTAGDFTANARAYATDKSIRLLHGAPLAKLIARVDRGTRGWFRFR